MEDALSLFLTGLLAGGYATAALFFARFWRDTHDRLFGMFSAAFLLLALQRAALSMVIDQPEVTPALYVLRLVAFVIIIAAIVDKNRATRASP